MEEARALLDQLMGRDRNVSAAEKNTSEEKKINWMTQTRYCPYFLVDFWYVTFGRYLYAHFLMLALYRPVCIGKCACRCVRGERAVYRVVERAIVVHRYIAHRTRDGEYLCHVNWGYTLICNDSDVINTGLLFICTFSRTLFIFHIRISLGIMLH